MGIGVVLLFWAAPVIAAAAISIGLLRRGGPGFRRSRPLAYAATLAAPLVLAAPMLMILAAALLGTSSSPGQAYRTLFGAEAPSCVTLLNGRTYVTTDAELASVSFFSTCADEEARFARFGLHPPPRTWLMRSTGRATRRG